MFPWVEQHGEETRVVSVRPPHWADGQDGVGLKISAASTRRSDEGGITPAEVTVESPWLVGHVHPRQRTSYHLSTTICHIFTPFARPTHDEFGSHHSTCDPAAWPPGCVAVGRQ